ncbi:arylsulfatase [Streptomyces caelestis]|uniref:Arylsulfatase n=1 Tax=Streptomyces caelestis TaxID=36816 RepID=A0A0M8QM07_9ACTN|nr:arylsulfatase [Streptomyces caelestis]
MHTSPVHVPVFDALRDEDHPGLELRHTVAEDLWERARGPAAVADEVRARVREVVDRGARAVRCTRSAIGGVAEATAVGLAVLESTPRPTAAPVEEGAARAGRSARVRAVSAEGAWACFEAGDPAGCARRVADAADAVTGADAIVLAQASVAPAERLTTIRVPVLSRPRAGLAAAARLRHPAPRRRAGG